MCTATLDPVNYPPVQRFMREPINNSPVAVLHTDVSDLTALNACQSEIHVMSYNLLTSFYATQKSHSHASQEILDFDFRGPRIVEEINSSAAQVICLQEVDRLDFYGPELQKIGFQIVRYYRDNTEEGRENPFMKRHEIVIAYRAELLTLIDCQNVPMRDLAAEFTDIEEFNYENQGMLCLFSHRESKKNLIVGNCHLQWNPAKDYVKMGQAAYLLSKAARYVKDTSSSANPGSPLPVILAGDFNSQPISSALSTIYAEDIILGEPNEKQTQNASTFRVPADCGEREKEIYQRVQKWVTRKKQSRQLMPLYGKMRSAYENYQCPPNKITADERLTRDETFPSYTNYTVNFKGTLDHIFYNQDALKVKHLLEIPEQKDLQMQTAIPSTKYPSDHFRIEAIFTFN